MNTDTEPRTVAGRAMLAAIRSSVGATLIVERRLVRAVEDESWNAALAAVERAVKDRREDARNNGYDELLEGLDIGSDLIASLRKPVTLPETFTGQMSWPCVCGHPKGDHYFGDGLGADGQPHTSCQTCAPVCHRFRPVTP